MILLSSLKKRYWQYLYISWSPIWKNRFNKNSEQTFLQHVSVCCLQYNIVDRLEQTEKHTLFGQMINLPKKRIVSILDQLLVYSIFVSDDLNLCLPPYKNLVWWMFFIIHNLLWNTLKLNTPTSGVLNQIKSLVWLDHRWDFSNYISPKHIASIKIIIQL